MLKKNIVLVFILLTLPPLSLAQGSRHDNIAYSYTVNGSVTTVSVIPNAIITVCNGIILPSPGTICSTLAIIYNNQDLSPAHQISNPTNADGFGNYGFFVPAGSYIISVSGVGLTTYSYPLKLPCTLDGNCTITGNWTFTGTVNIPSGTAFTLPLPLAKDTFTHTLTATTLTAPRTWTLQDASDTFVFQNTADILTNKTIGVNLNTLQNLVNTSGHYLRNNGTKYVDNTIQSADLPLINLASGAPGGVTGNLPHGNLNGGTGASSSTAWFGDDTWKLAFSPSTATFRIQAVKKVTGCNTGGGSNSACTDTLTWPTAFADTTYIVTCQGMTPNQFIGQSTTNQAAGLVIDSYTTTTVTTTTETFRSTAAQFSEIHCIGIHP